MDSHDWFQNGGVRVAIIGTLAILALFLFVQTASVAQNIGRPGNPATDTITVNGQGSASIAPDIASISFTVEHKETTVAAAQKKTTDQTNAAIAYLEKQNIDKKDVRTTSYNIYPEYSSETCVCPAGSYYCPPCRTNSTITGYRVSQSIEVKVRDLDATGTIIGGLGEMGVQNLYGPNLTLDDPAAGYNAARADAIAKAKAQAHILADQLGVRLGRIVSFSESSGGYFYGKAYPAALEAYGRGGDASAPAPEIPTGENEYTAHVSITYEIR